MNLIPGIR